MVRVGIVDTFGSVNGGASSTAWCITITLAIEILESATHWPHQVGDGRAETYLGFSPATSYAGGADTSSLCRCRGRRAFIFAVRLGPVCLWIGFQSGGKVIIGRGLVVGLVLNLGFRPHNRSPRR